MKKLLFIIIILIPLFTLNCFASTYEDIYSSSGIEAIEQITDDGVKDVLQELGINLKDFTSFTKVTPKSVFGTILSFADDIIKAPLSALTLCLGLIILNSTFSGLFLSNLQMNSAYSFTVQLSLTVVLLLPLGTTVSAAMGAVKSVCTFMVAFIPVFGVVLITSGATASAAVYSTTMLAFCEGISAILSYFVTPIVSAYMCIGVASMVSGTQGAYYLSVKIKNFACFFMGLVSTVFTGFLSLQTTIAKSADNLAVKTTKFFCGSLVPFAGGALSEALTTVFAGMGIIRSTAFGWGVLVIIIMLLPFVLEVLVWQMALTLLSSVSSLFGLKESVLLIEILKAALGFLMAIMLTVSAIYIISLATVKAGGG